MLSVYQSRFLEIAVMQQALKFGEFTLKSGRKSPYFFNAGAFCDGASLYMMAQSYAHLIAKMIEEEGIKIDVLFGPAYKGIPLVATVSTVLYHEYTINLPWAFNRKEAKDHGEGGVIVGADLKGKKVLILDDVLTAGTAVRESLTLLRNLEASPVALVIALDRKEKIEGSDQSALMQIACEEQLLARAVVDLDDLLNFVKEQAIEQEVQEAIQAYRAQYSVEKG